MDRKLPEIDMLLEIEAVSVLNYYGPGAPTREFLIGFWYGALSVYRQVEIMCATRA
jgi:hypothetical protein